VAMAREARWTRRFLMGWSAGVVYWFGVCYWIQFVLAFHGGLGEAAGWAVFLLFALAREPRPLRRFLLGWASGVVYWFGVCYWIQFVLAFHGGLGSRARAISKGASATGASHAIWNRGKQSTRSAADSNASSQFSTGPGAPRRSPHLPCRSFGPADR
jgi:hypothetical protein